MDQIKDMVKACIVSRKGGISLSEIDGEYRELVGTNIPYAKYGFRSLEDFILSITEINVVHNPDGSVVLKTKDPKTSHLSALIEQQKPPAGKTHKKATTRFANGGSHYEVRKKNVTHPKNERNGYKISSTASRDCTITSYSGKHKSEDNEGEGGNFTERMENTIKHNVVKASDKLEERTRQRMDHSNDKMLPYTSNAAKLGVNSIEKEQQDQGNRTGTENYASNNRGTKNGLLENKMTRISKNPNQHLQQITSTGVVDNSGDVHKGTKKFQPPIKNPALSMDDNILVTITNDLFRGPVNKRHNHQKIVGDHCRTVQLERDFIPSEKTYEHNIKFEFIQEMSAVKHWYRTKPVKGSTKYYYGSSQKWAGEDVDDGEENLNEDDDDWEKGFQLHCQKTIPRYRPGLLIKVANEYAVDKNLKKGT